MTNKWIIKSAFGLLLLTAAAAAPLPDLFVTADRCLSCHNGLVTSQGEDISIGVDWRSSMMAHASRDPYWQASVRRETLVYPTAQAEIEHECAACHMPMSRYLAKVNGKKGRIFEHLPIVRKATPEDELAADGVSCSMCHQIQKDKLGQKESFTAGFVVDSTTPSGQRKIFGPYEVDEGRKALMRSSSLFLPNQAMHVQSSEICASCHTLFTHALNEKGEVVGELPEQVPYLEWKHSAYSNARSCQSCHMPEVDGRTPITAVMGIERENVSRHSFRGGNFFMPRILGHNRFELGVAALPQELETTSLRTAENLKTSAAALVLRSSEIKDGRLRAEILIQNLAGHKLPSAYPSRRAWIHSIIRDRTDKTVFESGRLNPDGSIQGNDNDADKKRFEPHYAEINSADEVQIYEGILANPENEVTTVLLAATRYIKDNRLLPDGFDKTTADEDIAVRGAAAEDLDFQGGSDTVFFFIPVNASDGPFTIQVELWYQPISYRWAHNLEEQEAEEIDRFVSYYNSFTTNSGIILARDKAIVK